MVIGGKKLRLLPLPPTGPAALQDDEADAHLREQLQVGIGVHVHVAKGIAEAAADVSAVKPKVFAVSTGHETNWEIGQLMPPS